MFEQAKATVRAGEITADGDGVYEIGSVTKVYTGVLLADMAVRGEVALDDPYAGRLRPAWRQRPPTLEELATHRSGLPNVPRALARGELRMVTGLTRSDPWA